MPDNTSTALAVGQIRMGGDMRFDFRFDRQRQKPTRTGSQNIRQRIGRKRPWLAKRNKCIFIYGVSSFLETGDLVIARIRRPHITTSPTFGHNSYGRRYGQSIHIDDARLRDHLGEVVRGVDEAH